MMQKARNLANDGTLDILHLVDQLQTLEMRKMVIVMQLINVHHQYVFQWQWMHVKDEKMKKMNATIDAAIINNNYKYNSSNDRRYKYNSIVKWYCNGRGK